MYIKLNKNYLIRFTCFATMCIALKTFQLIKTKGSEQIVSVLYVVQYLR
jgi:hypothetical protein